MGEAVRVSALGKTWIFDLDGTLVKHNGYKVDGVDTLLPGAAEFVRGLPPEDLVVILTSREESYREETLAFLRGKGIRFDHIIFGAPYGERIVVNDAKPSGLKTALAINTQRDVFMEVPFQVDPEL